MYVLTIIYGYYRVKDLHGRGGGNAPSSYPTPVTAEEREVEQAAVPHESLEKSLELQSFQQAISQLDAAEEEILEEHRTMIQVVYHDWRFSTRYDATILHCV